MFTVNQLEPYSWRSLGSVSEQLNAEMGRRHEYTSRVHEYTPVVPNVARFVFLCCAVLCVQ